jgi:hypothetical protein
VSTLHIQNSTVNSVPGKSLKSVRIRTWDQCVAEDNNSPFVTTACADDNVSAQNKTQSNTIIELQQRACLSLSAMEYPPAPGEGPATGRPSENASGASE